MSSISCFCCCSLTPGNALECVLFVGTLMKLENCLRAKYQMKTCHVFFIRVIKTQWLFDRSSPTCHVSKHARCLSKNAFELPVVTRVYICFSTLSSCSPTSRFISVLEAHTDRMQHTHFKNFAFNSPHAALCSLANSLTRSLVRSSIPSYGCLFVRSLAVCIFHSFDVDDGVYRPFVCVVNGGALAVAWCCICYHLLTGAPFTVCIYGNNLNSTISNIASFESVESVVSCMSLR